MERRNVLKLLGLALLTPFVAPVLAALPKPTPKVPHVFKAGEILTADKLNENFFYVTGRSTFKVGWLTAKELNDEFERCQQSSWWPN